MKEDMTLEEIMELLRKLTEAINEGMCKQEELTNE